MECIYAGAEAAVHAIFQDGSYVCILWSACSSAKRLHVSLIAIDRGEVSIRSEQDCKAKMFCRGECMLPCMISNELIACVALLQRYCENY